MSPEPLPEASPHLLRTAGLVAALVVLGALFKAALLIPSVANRGMRVVEWSGDGCVAGLRNEPPFFSIAVAEPSAGGECVSEVFVPTAPLLEVEYLSDGKPRATAVVLEDATGKVLEKIAPDVPDGKWRFRRFVVDEHLRGDGVRVRLRHSEHAARLLVRSRVAFAATNPSEQRLHDLLTDHLAKMVTVAFALGLALFVVRLDRLRSREQFFCYLLLAFLVHYQPHLSFCFDEWHMLERIHRDGLSALFLPHNEHFIPVATALYALEYRLFGGFYDGYVLVSLVLLALCGAALKLLLERLLRGIAGGSAASTLLGALFVVNGMQAEAVQWCMCQGTLLSVVSSLRAMSVTWDFARAPSKRRLVAIAGWTLLAVFSFAGAFSLALQLPVIFLLARLSRGADEASDPNTRTGALKLGAALFLSLALAFVCYAFAPNTGGLRMSKPETPAASEVIGYILGGAQFGTVLRGLGFYSRAESPPFLRSLPDWSDDLPDALVLSFAGGLASLGLFAFAYFAPERRRFITLCIVGELFVILPFLLTGIGRARFGAEYAIRSLRYQTPALVGLALLVAPLVVGFSRNVRARGLLLGVLLSAHLFAQLRFIERFDTFRYYGALNTRYLSQLESWRESFPNRDFLPSFEQSPGAPGSYPIQFWGHGKQTVAIPTAIHPVTMSAILFE